MKKISLYIMLLVIGQSIAAYADVTISPLPFISLQAGVFPPEIKRSIEISYNQAIRGNMQALTSNLSEERASRSLVFHLKKFGEQLSSPSFCSLLAGYQAKLSDNQNESAYIIVFNIVSGASGKSYGVNNAIHIWIANKTNNKLTLLIPDAKSFVKMLPSELE